MDRRFRGRLGILARSAVLAAACGAGDASPPGAGPGGTSVRMDNFSYAPARLRLPGGSTIVVRNANAATSHTFTVAGSGIDVEVAPLASAEVAIDLPPGRYRFACRFHAAQGMEGTLIVT